MNFFKKRSTAWSVLAIVIVASFFIGQFRKPGPELETLPSGRYVQDNANVLSASTEKYITEMNNGLVSAAAAEIQVATIDTTAGEDIFDMAFELAYETNLSDNCCVFLIAVDDIEAVIVQGDALVYAFSDDELSAILNRNFTVEDFTDRDMDDGVRASFADLIEMYEDHYGIRVIGSSEIVRQPQTVTYRSDVSLVLVCIAIILLIIIVSAVITRPRGRRTVMPGGTVRHTTHRTGNYPPRGSYNTPPPFSGGSSRSGGFGSGSRGGSFGSSSRSGGFSSSSRTSSSRGGSFSSSSRGGSFSSSSRSGGFGGSSRSGGFGGGSRGGSFGGGSRGGGFRK